MSLPVQRDVDLAVVGASFAGLQCAKAAAMRGLRVTVLERKPEPGARLRTTGILVKEAADEIDFPVHLGRRILGVRLYDSRYRSVDLSSPGYFFVATQTDELLRYLASEARRSGASIQCNSAVTAIEPLSQGGYFLPEAGIRCRYLIGADGANSKVAQILGLGHNTRFLYGVEAEFPLNASIDPTFLHCFSNAKFAPGYIGWALAGPKVVQMGIATAQTEKPALNAFIDEIAPRFDLSTEDILARRAGVIPCGGRVMKFSAPRAMLIGDAAGWVSPLTGGGIQLAFRLGRRAGQLVSDYLTDGGGNPADTIKKELPNFTIKKAMRSCANLLPSNTLLDGALKTRPMRSLARQIYFHRRGGKGVPLTPGSLDFAAWAHSRSGQLVSDDGPAP